MSVTGYLGLLDLGVRGSVTYYIAKFHTQGKHEEASHVVSSALAVFTGLGILALAGSIVLSIFITKLFHVPSQLKSDLQVIAVLAGLSMALTLVANVYGAVVIGLQRFDLANAIDMGLGLLKAALTLVVLWRGHALMSLAIIHVTGSAATGILYALITRKLYPQLRVWYSWSDRLNARLIFSFGSYLFFLNASTYLVLYTDSLVIGAFLPVAMVTFFAIGGNLIASARSLVSGISTTMTPLASSLDAGGNLQQIRTIALGGPRYATMLVLPIAITLALRGKTFIGLWMGGEYAGPSSAILQVLSLALFLTAANQVATSTMLGLNKHRPLVFVNIAEGIVNLALSIVLVQRLGIVGVALGTAIPNLVTSFCFWPPYIRRVFAISGWTYLSSTWIRPAAAAIPFALTSLAIDRMWYAPSVWFFLLQVILTLPVAMLSFWFCCFTSTERLRLVGQMFSPALRISESA